MHDYIDLVRKKDDCVWLALIPMILINYIHIIKKQFLTKTDPYDWFCAITFERSN